MNAKKIVSGNPEECLRQWHRFWEDNKKKKCEDDWTLCHRYQLMTESYTKKVLFKRFELSLAEINIFL